MMHGSVNHLLEAVVPIQVMDGSGKGRDFDAKIDNGFSGGLVLPEKVAREMQLPFLRRQFATLADESVVWHNTYSAEVRWHGGLWQQLVYAFGSEPLIGTALLSESRLEVEYVPFGEVRISRLSGS